MHGYKKRQPIGSTLLKFFAMSVGTLALFLLSVVAVRAAWGMYGTFQVAVEARDNAEGQLASLKSDQARLTAAVAEFDTPTGLEREMRERFGVARPGEGVIEIMRQNGSSTVEQGSQDNPIIKMFKSLFLW